MTIGEILLIIESYNKKSEDDYKTKLAVNYALAVNISQFVGKVLNGKPIPSFRETYPDLFKDEEYESQQWMVYKERLMDFANRHNKRRG